jgi:hypothetical protein
MTRIVIHPGLQSQLQGFTQPVELCDESWRVLGQFTPALDLSLYEPLEPQVSEEELLRRSQSQEKTYTTAEVLSSLGKL